MSNTIYCNTVVINNHPPRPTYKEILASPIDQPTAGAAKVPFDPNRSPMNIRCSNNNKLVQYGVWCIVHNTYHIVVLTTTTTTTTMIHSK